MLLLGLQGDCRERFVLHISLKYISAGKAAEEKDDSYTLQ